MALLGRGTGFWDIHIYMFPIVSSRVFCSARPLSDVAASQGPSVAAAAEFLYSPTVIGLQISVDGIVADSAAVLFLLQKELDEKVANCTFLLSMRCSPSLLRNKQNTQVSRLKALSPVATTWTERQVSACMDWRIYLVLLPLLSSFILRHLATPALRLGFSACLVATFGGFRVSALVYHVRRMGSFGIALIRRVSLQVHVFLDFAYYLILNFGRAPGPSGDREGWPWLRLLVVHVPSCWTAQSKRTYVLHQTLSICVPVQVCIVEGAPGRNRWGVAETPLSAKSQGRTRAAAFNVSVF